MGTRVDHSSVTEREIVTLTNGTFRYSSELGIVDERYVSVDNSSRRVATRLL